MNNCPKCGALVSNEQDKCSMCGAILNNSNNNTNNNETNNTPMPNILNNNEIIEIDNKPIDNNIDKKEEENVTPTTNKPSDEEKKNIMSSILQEHQEKTKVEEKDNTTKTVIFSIVVVLLIIVIGVIGVFYIIPSINKSNSNIILEVENNANNYSKTIENYMKRYVYKVDKINQPYYIARTRNYNFLSIPLSGKCTFKDNVWTGSDNDEITCEKFFNDINENYCHIISCNIPSEAEIYLKETYVKEIIDEEEQTIIEGEILDGTTLVYDDMICTKSGSKYTCNKK